MMDSLSYDPKELLITLMEMKEKLKSTIAKHCPDHDMSICDDLDKALEDFFQLQHVGNNEIGYLSSQLALLHLFREVERTMEVVVNTNNLRAYYDFKLAIEEENRKAPTLIRHWKSSDLILAAVLGGLLAAALSLFFVLP